MIFLTRQPKCFVGDCWIPSGLYQQEPWVHWQQRAGAQAAPVPISFHMIILNFTADGFYWDRRRWPNAKIQRGECSEVREKVRGGREKIGRSADFIASVWDRGNLWMWPTARCSRDARRCEISGLRVETQLRVKVNAETVKPHIHDSSFFSFSKSINQYFHSRIHSREKNPKIVGAINPPIISETLMRCAPWVVWSRSDTQPAAENNH